MQRTLIIAVFAGAVALAGCTTTDPRTGETRPTHATEGAVAGGLIGAAIGALARPHHAWHGAAVGGVIGALTGAAIGSSIDQREAYWRYHMRHRHVAVYRRGDRVVLSMRSDLMFQSGSADVNPNADVTLRRVAGMLRRHPHKSITIAGYTDTVGDGSTNMALSRERAEAVANVLEHYGVDPSRVNIEGYGETHQRVQTPDGVEEPRNRRVEIVLEAQQG